MSATKKTSKKTAAKTIVKKSTFGQRWRAQSKFRRAMWVRIRKQLKREFLSAKGDDAVIEIYEELTGETFNGYEPRKAKAVKKGAK